MQGSLEKRLLTPMLSLENLLLLDMLLGLLLYCQVLCKGHQVRLEGSLENLL